MVVDRKIHPLDLQPRKAVGIGLPFTGRAVFNQTFQTKDAIKTNLILHFLTSKRERYLNPEVGSSIGQFLFEQMTPQRIQLVESLVREELELFFPKLTIEGIGLIPDTDRNTLQFSLRYSIKNTEEEGEVILNFLT